MIDVACPPPAADAVVLAAHPDRHPYVDAVRPASSAGVSTVEMGSTFWDVEALVGRDVDVVHLHFGFEPVPLTELDAWIAALGDAGIALVHTVHDLANPHLVDQHGFLRQVASIVTASDALLTITPGAAQEVRRRFGRNARVVGHPPIFSHCPGPHEDRPVAVTINLGQLRPNLDLDVVERVVGAVTGTGGAVVHVRAEAVARSGAPVRAQLDRIAATDGVDLRIGGHLSDEQLEDTLRSARVALLAYRWGTHSGMVEAALDCGAAPLASRCGHYGDQGAVLYDDPASAAAAALRLSADHGPLTSPAQRSAHRTLSTKRIRRATEVADIHAAVYRSVALAKVQDAVVST